MRSMAVCRGCDLLQVRGPDPPNVTRVGGSLTRRQYRCFTGATYFNGKAVSWEDWKYEEDFVQFSLPKLCPLNKGDVGIESERLYGLDLGDQEHGVLTLNDLNEAFRDIECLDCLVKELTVNQDTLKAIKEWGSEVLSPATEEEVMKTGMVGFIWGARLYQSCPPGEVMVEGEVFEE